MDRTILIVDDVTVNRKIIAGSLLNKLNDITVFEAVNGVEALKVLAEQSISVVILDIMMPEKDGIQVLTEMKTEKIWKNIPVIMCSALNDIENVEKALSLGAVDYFSKPLDTEQMHITLPLKVKNALEYYEQKIQLIRFHDHIQAEMRLAEKLQKSIVTNHLRHEGVEMWGRYIPCCEIGGDFFVCKPVEAKTWFMIADVAGHGIAAAMISTMLNVLFNTAIREPNTTPGAVLQNMNGTLCEICKNIEYGFVSAFVGCLDDDGLMYANAGHPYPFIHRKTAQQIMALEANGFLLGMMENAHYQTNYCEFGMDDLLILYTDGLFDKGKDAEFAKWFLIGEYYKAYHQQFSSNVEKALDRMIHYFWNRRENGFIDDAAIMIIRKGP